jgi:hypothetical protein
VRHSIRHVASNQVAKMFTQSFSIGTEFNDPPDDIPGQFAFILTDVYESLLQLQATRPALFRLSSQSDDRVGEKLAAN